MTLAPSAPMNAGGCHFAYGGHGGSGGYYEPQAWQGAGNYSEDQEEVDWHEIRQAEWLQHIQNQYFSRWSVDKQDEWQAYQAKFNSAQDAGWSDQGKETQASASSSGSRRSAQEYRKQHEMKVISSFSGTVPQPIQDFQAAGLPEKVLKEIQDAKFSEPTPIQAQCWPILSNGHDLIGIAKSGSGKTLAFLGPGFAQILRSGADVHEGPMALVLAPTRELARQIQLEALRFGRSSGILCCSCTGGESKADQLEWLKRGCHIIVATPGRLNEFCENKQVWLGQISYLTLDEADRMLDMGFEPQIRRIIEECPRERQTLLFSATWPKAVRQLAFDFLQRPVHVHIGEMNAAKANTDVTQHVVLLERLTDKDRKLDEMLSQHLGEEELAIVFVSTKRCVQDIARLLWHHSFGVAEIHGDKDQRERDLALRSFTNKEKRVMVATDVASRGLDIKGVKLVINYDAANTPEDYVHRIGRTGRAGEKGLSYTFLVKEDPLDLRKAKAILEVMQTAEQEVPEELRELVGVKASKASKGGRGKGGGKGGKKGGFKGASKSKGPPPGPLAGCAPINGGLMGGYGGNHYR